jgi:hypothetical protein
MDDLNARLGRLRALVAADGEAVRALRQRHREVAAQSQRVREHISEWLDRMQRTTAG